MKDAVRIPITAPYSGDKLLEICQEHFHGYSCSQCQADEMSIIISNIPQDKIKHVGLKCETCDFSESAGEVDVSHAASALYVRKWIKLPPKTAINESEDRWDRI